MNDKTKAAIERLREHANDFVGTSTTAVERDILTVCNAAEQRDDLLAKIEHENPRLILLMLGADTKRLDWLEKLDAGLWKGITREAIDAAMKEEK